MRIRRLMLGMRLDALSSQLPILFREKVSYGAMTR